MYIGSFGGLIASLWNYLRCCIELMNIDWLRTIKNPRKLGFRMRTRMDFGQKRLLFIIKMEKKRMDAMEKKKNRLQL